MPLDRHLLDAYRAAEYAAFVEGGELVLRIGGRDPRLDAFLGAHGVAQAAFVSAANPGSRRRNDTENAAAHAALLEEVARAGHRYLPGEGRSPDGSWREPSLLVLGIARGDAEALGRRFGQNAIVVLHAGRAPQLVVLV